MIRKERNRLILVFVLILILALYVDLTNDVIQEDGSIGRTGIGDESKEIDLYLEAEGIFAEQKYSLEIKPELPTREKASQYIEMAIVQIEKEFEVIDSKIGIQDSYVDGLVKAEWRFYPSGYIRNDGEIVLKDIPKEGILMQAEVVLSCGEYEEIYCFPFQINAPTYSEEELLLQEIDHWLEIEMQREGKNVVQLPKEINGISLKWTEEKEYLVYKIAFLEMAAVGLILLSQKQKKKEAEVQRKRELELSYPDLVNQLVILLQAGMTTRQAWNRIAIQYEEKQNRGKRETKEVFEAVVRLNRRLQEGEKERIAYDLFTEEVNIVCYRRLMRILVANLEMGNRDLNKYLEEESQKAYEQRVLLAKKLGEEASTKMLIPLMIMLVLVMIIVMAPAMMEFSV